MTAVITVVILGVTFTVAAAVWTRLGRRCD